MSRSLFPLAAIIELEFESTTHPRSIILDLIEIDATLARSPNGHGSPRLRQVLALYREPVIARAPTERRFLALIRKAGLPRPAINTFVAGHEIDAYWDASASRWNWMGGTPTAREPPSSATPCVSKT